jgi:hypothetical protein
VGVVAAAIAAGLALAMERRVVRYCGIREGGGGSRRDVRRPPLLLIVEISFSKGRGDKAAACLYACADLCSCAGSLLSSLCSSSGWVGNCDDMRLCDWVDLGPIVVELIAVLNCC